jgi:Cellulase (glycosyl hydrolase family 5)
VTARWSANRAQAWADARGWLVGCNYTPAYAVNQIEMWAEQSFDPTAIDRELGLAAGLGFNTLRVYLHDLAWSADPDGFKMRIDRFLGIAAAHGMTVLVVLFDDCWHEPVTGPQPHPRAGVHNSGWARSPGRTVLLDRAQWDRLEAYVTDIVGHFANDSRILAWDVYNELGNIFMPSMSLPPAERDAAMARCFADQPAQTEAALALLHLTFGWIRTINPIHPLTAGSWYDDHPINEQFYALSDIISFHNYENSAHLEGTIAKLKAHGRPMWCTEYLNRRKDCLFETHLPIFKREHVSAWNWGLVDGKIQTKYAWDDLPGRGEPDPWFHDILHRDGTAYCNNETDFLRQILSR